ncbi:hypothetical protein [Roseococcus sp.]|uniref:hypothetical protein n=1 Tax=Roseococcus sp. TaxID=2109646 RepID=UPI003BA8E277
MKAQRHPLTQLGVEDMPGCLIGIDLCIEIVNTSGLMFGGQALIRMRDAKGLVEGLMERAEDDAQQALAEEIAQEIAEAPQDGARQEKAAQRVAAHIVKTANNRGKAPSVWTKERLALLDAECLIAESNDLLTRINARPGPPCASTNAMRTKFNTRLRKGLVKRSAGVVAPPAAATRRSTIPEEDKPEARQMVLGGKGAKDLVEEFGWNLEEAQAFAQAVRDEQKAAA